MRFLRWDLQGLRRSDSNLVSEKSAHLSDFSLFFLASLSAFLEKYCITLRGAVRLVKEMAAHFVPGLRFRHERHLSGAAFRALTAPEGKAAAPGQMQEIWHDAGDGAKDIFLPVQG